MELTQSAAAIRQRRCREKLKSIPERLAEAKKKDAERKKMARLSRKYEVACNLEKYKEQIEYEKALNRERVRRCRSKKAGRVTPEEGVQSKLRMSVKHNSWRHAEKQLELSADAASKEMRRLQNRSRVRDFRLRVKLKTAQGERLSTCNQPNERDEELSSSPSSTGYQHTSSESRAYKRVHGTLPKTPAKKIRLVEKVYENSTPRTRSAFKNSRVLSKAFNKRLDMDSSIVDAVVDTKSDPKRNKLYKQVCKIVAGKMKDRNYRDVAQRLKIDKRTLKRHKVVNAYRKHGLALSDENEEKVRQFYLNNISRPMPNAKDVMYVKDADGKRQPVPKHLLVVTQQEGLKAFHEKHPEIKIGQRKFDYLRPNQCQRMKSTHRIVCCCTYCENVVFKSKCFNKFMADNDHKDIIMNSRELLEATMCAKGENQFHKMCQTSRTIQSL